MSWKYAWRYRWKLFVETVTTPDFWWTLLGIVAALAVWFFLFYLAIKHLDTSLVMRSTFCASDEERNRRILVIVLTTPLFLVGLIGVIGESLAILDNRRAGRRHQFRPLVVFALMLQVTAAIILYALQC